MPHETRTPTVQPGDFPTRVLRSFLEVSIRLTQDLDIGRVLTTIVERSMELTSARYGAVVTLTAAGDIESFLHRGLTPQQVSALPHLPKGKGLLGEVLTTRRTIRVEDISRHPASVGFPANHVPMCAFLGVPLLQRSKLVGALYLTKGPEQPPFTPEDEELVTAMASMAATGIENARLYELEAERARVNTLLRDIASRVAGSLDEREILSTFVERLGPAAEVDRCFIRLVESDDLSRLSPVEFEWDAPGIRPLKEDPERQFPVASLAAVTGTTQRSEDVVNDPRSESGEFSQGAESLLEYGTRAVLAAPLKRGEEVTGVVVFHSSRPRKWSDSEVLLIEEAAKEAASALHNARLYRAAVDTAERLEELDCLRRNFLSMVSHELRSPMAVIAGISDVLSRTAGTEGDERQRRLIDTLGRESRRLARLVSEVLDLEAIEQRRLPIELQPTDLLGLAEEAAADSGEDHRVVVRCDASEAVVEADRDRIKQVLLNLLSNAIKYSPPERPVRIEIRPFLGEGQEQGEVTVAVVDEGPGIPGSEMGRVFEPFTRLSSASRQPGWGLGLYLTRMIVGLHGGRIWVESEPGRGSTFLFSLPRGPRRPAEEPS